jgi:hypothetical protein
LGVSPDTLNARQRAYLRAIFDINQALS